MNNNPYELNPQVQDQDYIQQLSVDCVIFGFHQNQLKVLVSRFKNTDLWGLLGGYVRQQENIDDAAKRILYDTTRLEGIYLEQYHTFGEYDRTSNEQLQLILQKNQIPIEDSHWMLRRFVSIGYYALVDFSQVQPSPGFLCDICEWYDLQQLPTLVLDHEVMIRKALACLQGGLDQKLVGFSLLPETFTMAELKILYETILAKKIRMNNFQRKILDLNILERIEKKYTGAAHKAPYLYRIAQRDKIIDSF
jgi:ADP-ribose pyrophosphatase YjhB (NUDIX family)